MATAKKGFPFISLVTATLSMALLVILTLLPLNSNELSGHNLVLLIQYYPDAYTLIVLLAAIAGVTSLIHIGSRIAG